MKTFLELKTSLTEKKSNVVFDKKMGEIPVKITKDNNKFSVYIDGDLLDTYNSMKHAKSSLDTAIKELGK